MASFSAWAVTFRAEYLSIYAGLHLTTVLRDCLIEQAEKDAREGKTKRAYLEALGGGFSSIAGRTWIGSAAGAIAGSIVQEGMGAVIGATSGGLSGTLDLVQSVYRISRIVNDRRPADIPPKFIW